MNKTWTEFELNYLRENCGHITDEVGAAQLSKIVRRKITTYAWRKKRQELGIVKASGRGICKIVERR